MGDVIDFRQLTGVLCPHCGERMAYLQDRNEIRCTEPGCGLGFLRPTSGKMVIRREGNATVIETK